MNARRTGFLAGGVLALALLMTLVPLFAQAASAKPPAEMEDVMNVQTEGDTIHLVWKAAEQAAARAPERVAFRGGRGLKFDSAAKTGLEVDGRVGRRFWAGRGPLTLAMVVQPTTLEADQSPLCSKWISVDGKRSFELGLSRAGRLYWQVSASGRADARREKMEGDYGLLPGRPYAVAAVFDPRKRMAIYINGHLSAELTENVPDGICQNDTPVFLGAQSSGNAFSDMILGDVWIHPRALDEAAIAQWAAGLQLTEAPPDARTDWERVVLAPPHDLPPVRALTHGPKPHWFGYYDKFQTDPTDRYVLSLQADFDLRVVEAGDVAHIGMIDTADGDKWIPLTESHAWNWQQGCMLQFRPGSDREILYNDCVDNQFVCQVMDIKTGKKRTLSRPASAVSPDGKTALCEDFRRIRYMRTVVGYAGGGRDPNRRVPAPDNSGIWRVDIDTGGIELILPLSQLAKIPYPKETPKDMLYAAHEHWNPAGTRFMFFTRGDNVNSRIMTANADGSDLRFITYAGSHFDWTDNAHLLIHTGGAYRLFKDDNSGKSEPILECVDGHNSILPGGEWMLTDTVPMGPDRVQHVYLYHFPSKRIVPIGHFPQPRVYTGDVRCDNHPRFSRDGKKIIIDSAHSGTRQMYMIDISGIVGDLGAAQ